MRHLYILLALVYVTHSHAQTSNIVGQVIDKDSVAIEGVAIILQSKASPPVVCPTSGIRNYVFELI